MEIDQVLRLKFRQVFYCYEVAFSDLKVGIINGSKTFIT
jgi:hypothetical protein